MSRSGRAQEAAPPVRVALEFQSSATRAACLTPAALGSGVEAQLARPVFVPPGSAEADVTLTVRVIAAGSDAVVELELIHRGESLGGRTLLGPVERCSALLDSLVVVVALLVDVPRDETPPEPAPPAATPASVAPTPPPVVPARPARPLLSELSLGARASLVSGLLPSGVGALGADAHWAFGFAPWLRLTAGVDVFQDNRVQGRGTSETTFGASDARFGLAPVRLQRGSLRVEPWAQLAVASLSAEGQGFATNSSGSRWLASTGLSLRAELPLVSRLVLNAGAGLWLNFARPRFLVEDSPGAPRELHRPSSVMPSAELGLSWRFL